MRTVAMENVGTEGGEEQEGDGKETETRQAHLHVGDKQQWTNEDKTIFIHNI